MDYRYRKTTINLGADRAENARRHHFGFPSQCTAYYFISLTFARRRLHIAYRLYGHAIRRHHLGSVEKNNHTLLVWRGYAVHRVPASNLCSIAFCVLTDPKLLVGLYVGS